MSRILIVCSRSSKSHSMLLIQFRSSDATPWILSISTSPSNSIHHCEYCDCAVLRDCRTSLEGEHINKNVTNRVERGWAYPSYAVYCHTHPRVGSLQSLDWTGGVFSLHQTHLIMGHSATLPAASLNVPSNCRIRCDLEWMSFITCYPFCNLIIDHIHKMLHNNMQA